MVMSYSSVMPHLFQRVSDGKYQCDDKCINWATSGICSHSTAVATTTSSSTGLTPADIMSPALQTARSNCKPIVHTRLPHSSLVSQQSTFLATTNALTVSPTPNINPFYVKFISRDIHVCQGCKGSLHMKCGTSTVLRQQGHLGNTSL